MLLLAGYEPSEAIYRGGMCTRKGGRGCAPGDRCSRMAITIAQLRFQKGSDWLNSNAEHLAVAFALGFQHMLSFYSKRRLCKKSLRRRVRAGGGR
jgi:hypothetical protein